jgi:predicted GH43/DUF377 family glycosyl hydrolase
MGRAGVFTLTALALACAEPRAGTATLVGPPFEYGPITVVDSVPALPRGSAGAWDDGLIDPGAVLRHAGRFHAFYNAIRTWPSPLSVGYATSVDGRVWERQPLPVLTTNDLRSADWTIRANSVWVERGRWMLFLSIGGEEGQLLGRIVRADADAPTGPWRLRTAPALIPALEWEMGGVGDAKVVPSATGYVMFYTARDAGGTTSIGRAESADGLTWTRRREPVLRRGRRAAFDAGGVSDPSVARVPDGGWIMTYRGVRGPDTAIGWATSQDGVSWIKAPQPLVSAASSNAWDVIYFSALVATQSRQMLLFEAGRADSGRTDVYAAIRPVTLIR